MLDRTGLAGQTAAADRADNVEFVDAVGNFKRLVDDHLQNRTGKIFVQGFGVDGNVAFTRLYPNAGNGVFSFAGSIGTSEFVAFRLADFRNGFRGRRFDVF